MFDNIRRLRLNFLITTVVIGWTVVGIYSQQIGPGLSPTTFPQDTLFKIISHIQIQAPELDGNGTFQVGNNLVAMHKGYMLAIGGAEGNFPKGAFGFFDISNPYDPKPVHIEYSEDTQDFLEVHGYGFSSSYAKDYVVFEMHTGIQVWDITDVRAPKVASKLQLIPHEANPGGYGRIWSLFWQAPYVYAAGRGFGMYIIDVSNPENPVLVKWLSTSDLGMDPGHLYAVGNLLVVVKPQRKGHLLMDISDPKNPQVISRFNGGEFYSSYMNGNKFYTGDKGTVHIYDINDPGNPVLEDSIPLDSGEGGEYLFIQDNHLIVGTDDVFYKFDLNTKALLGVGRLGHQPGHPVPIGNILAIGDDHGGTYFSPHQAQPDTKGPSVNMVNPKDGSTLQSLTSRMGITLTDHIDLQSVNNQTFIVREVGGQPLPGKYSGQQAILNFWPDLPLKPSTQYEVVVPLGGIKDWSGNATEGPFTSRFTTESAVPVFVPVIPGDSITAGATTQQAGSVASNVLDGDVSTLWESTGAGPQEITITLYKPFEIRGLQYTPRQIGGTTGTITQFEISFSSNGTDFTTVASGTWSDDNTVKFVALGPAQATHIRLKALQGSGGTISAAELNVYRTDPTNPGPSFVSSTPQSGVDSQNVFTPVILVFNQTIDFSSINPQTFIVQERGGSVAAGKFSSLNNRITFYPDYPYTPGSTIEVIVPAKGIRDWTGHGPLQETRFEFTIVPDRPNGELLIPQGFMRAEASSFNIPNEANKAIDGNPQTWWQHFNVYKVGTDTLPQHIDIYLHKPYRLESFEMTPIVNFAGRFTKITKYEIHTSLNNGAFILATSGNWDAQDSTIKRINFSPRDASTLRFRIMEVDSVVGERPGEVGEINLYGANSASTGVKNIHPKTLQGGISNVVYDLKGNKFQLSQWQTIPHGLYIIFDENGRQKIKVKFNQ